jgi:uncharacterized protein YnzC (UPF0291/DUF896 family)
MNEELKKQIIARINEYVDRHEETKDLTLNEIAEVIKTDFPQLTDDQLDEVKTYIHLTTGYE